MAGKRGPRPVFDDALKKRYLGLLRRGASQAEALTILGADRMTLKRALTADPKFEQGHKKAALTGELALVNRILKAGRTHWQASAWMLERKHWQKYGRRRADAYSPEQFNLFATKLSNLVRQFVPAGQRKAFDQALEGMMAELAREAAEQRTKA